MPTPHPTRFPLPLVLVLLAALAWAVPARAQIVQPWAPAGDSLVRLSSSAKLRFQRQQGDSIGGTNFDAYDIVSRIGLKLLAALGRENMRQAPAVESTLDSLGLDVEVSVDPQSTSMVFMLVRNPYRRTSDAVGFLYWMRAGVLHVQGADFPPCQAPVLKTWWTGKPQSPYEAAVIYHERKEMDQTALRLFRISADGSFWNLAQFEGNDPAFPVGMQLHFTDVNLDGKPEVVGYVRSEPESVLTLINGVAPIIDEYTFVERPEGYVLHNVRPVPGPTQTLSMFVSLVCAKQLDRARRLMQKPAALDSVIAQGWGRKPGRGSFIAEYGEQDAAWPEWLELRVRQDEGPKRWIVRFAVEDGRWVISDWVAVHKVKGEDESQALPPPRSGP